MELGGLERNFAAAGISLSAESEVKLTVCAGVPWRWNVLGLVEITISGEVAMTAWARAGLFRGMDVRKQKSVTPTLRPSGLIPHDPDSGRRTGRTQSAQPAKTVS